MWPRPGDTGPFGVELLDARPELSRTTQDRSLLTSMVMLIWPSAYGRKALVGLAAGVVLKPPPRDRALDPCSFVVDCERSTYRKVDSPLSIVTQLHSDSGRDVITGT